MTSVAPIDCLYCTLNPFAFSAWLYSSPRMYSSVKFFDPTMTAAPAFGAAGALAADISAAVSAARSPTIITERHFFLLIEPFLPVVYRSRYRRPNGGQRFFLRQLGGRSMAQATR